MEQLEAIYKQTSKMLASIRAITIDNEICKKIGEVAMDYIADYPLYASSSNISYDEAIAIAFILGGGDELEKAYFSAKIKKVVN
ncbi:hypothetical protein OFO01_07245 [Campylobacter sp. JMF_01 NE2]|uniref:hypothetical protein n=1 Tax=unclassified Campylobacter TaxID=2593542 RepID=UPI0022E9F39B|nr:MULTISPECIES: hypothetical protein [unclassified Campylobacter]MDA3053241.1 hypothetical protein [Campylobacter sp. JMF_03 NE3]MDA3067576.1 hypothetical protein [Campylobacter sp. JMF_01 NE2]